VTHTFENLLAGSIIDFDPYTAGSPACPAACDIPAEFQIPQLIAAISAADPSNETLATWVSQYAIDPSLVNEPTQDEINASIALLQTGIYNLDATTLSHVDEALASINPALPELYTNAGYFTDPAYVAYDGTGPLDPEFGGYNPMLVFNDLVTLATNNEWNFNAATPEVLWFLAAPLTSPDPYADSAGSAASAAAEAPNLLANLDPTAFSADLSTILAGLGTTAGSDALSAALADISAQFTADLASFAPSLASLF
jgi:hypothetical protein